MAAEVIGQLREQLRSGEYRVFTSDLGVRVVATGLATYPDASVIGGPTERDPEKKTNVVNPRVLVEVTSDGTEHYDRGEKREHYKQSLAKAPRSAKSRQLFLGGAECGWPRRGSRRGRASDAP